MRIVADFHIHSKYARATSPRCEPDGLSEGAKVKGINVMATGDFTHPDYFAELKQKLKRNELDQGGLFSYNGINFILSTEISCIYGTKNLKTYKARDSKPQSTVAKRPATTHSTLRMHHIVLAPNFEVAEQINDALGKVGNLASDGRPILGITSPALVEKLMGISKDILVVPAHCWTPWFGVFGSQSGVDAIEEAFEDQSKHIHALETGLSSDPAMNWMLSKLDKYTLLSNSDAHSIEKLGREANVFDLEELSYAAIIKAIKTRKGFVKTYEFYPEEGKYHYDGHRNCDVNLHPNESAKYNGFCPVCKKPLTIGVLSRVHELADRKYGFVPENAVPFQHIVPLPTVISKVLKKPETSVVVREEHSKLIRYFGNEFAVYEASEEQLRLATSIAIANALMKVNKGNIQWIPGYDGVFGELLLDDGKQKRATDKKQKTNKLQKQFVAHNPPQGYRTLDEF